VYTDICNLRSSSHVDTELLKR